MEKEKLEIVKKLAVDLLKNEVQNCSSIILRNNGIPSNAVNLLLKTGAVSSQEYRQLAPYIEMLGLHEPQKLIKFVIDLHLAEIESINEGINSIRNDLLTSDIQKIPAMADKLANMTPGDVKPDLLKNYTDQMIDVISQLEGKIKNYISEIKRIDDLPRYKFFLQASFNKSKVDSAVKMTRAALEAYFEALDIYAVLANERNNKPQDYLERKENFINGLEMSLVLAYDKEKSGFWNTNSMLKRITNSKASSDKLNKYLGALKLIEVDFENDINFNL